MVHLINRVPCSMENSAWNLFILEPKNLFSFNATTLPGVIYLVFRKDIFFLQHPQNNAALYYAIIIASFVICDSELPSLCVVQSVRTVKLTYASQFDLEKPVKVRILTMLKCACTNGTEVQGEETEKVYTPEPTGKDLKTILPHWSKQEQRPAIRNL